MSHVESIHYAVRLLLRPVLRFCLRYSLKVQDLTAIVKMELINEAKNELGRRQLPVNASKLSVMTGLQRAEVSKILKEPQTENNQAENSNVISKVVTQWRVTKKYQDESGNPRSLSVKGKKSEFAQLVQSINKYLNPYTILFELERLGYISHVDGKNKIKLNSRLHLVADDFNESFAHLSVDVHDLLEAVRENVIENPEVRNLHLRTAFDNLSSEDLEEIKEWLLDKGTEYHQEVSEYLAGFDLDTNPKRKGVGGRRVAFTTFSVSDSEE